MVLLSLLPRLLRLHRRPVPCRRPRRRHQPDAAGTPKENKKPGAKDVPSPRQRPTTRQWTQTTCACCPRCPADKGGRLPRLLHLLLGPILLKAPVLRKFAALQLPGLQETMADKTAKDTNGEIRCCVTWAICG